MQYENCLFGAVQLAKNANKDKYGYSGYGIGFDTRSSFSLSNRNGFSKMCMIFQLSKIVLILMILLIFTNV